MNQTGFTNAFSLSLLPNSLVLNAAFPSVLVCPDGASVNVCQMIDTLNAINGKCPPATQAVIDKLLFMTPSELEVAVLQLISVFKKAQFLLEKLDLLIHKELEPFLYEAKEGISLFALAGYDSLKQGSSPSYLYGYRGKSFYQFLGTTWKHNHFAWLLGLGVSETNFIVGPQIGKAHFTTLYGNLGASANFSRWKFGLDAMFSEGMLSGYRKIAFLGLQAKNKHNLWNASIDGKLSYTIKSSYIDTCLYEQIGYDIGKENPYLEYQATGVNQDVKHEKISVLRNALGLMLTTPEKKPWLAFVDGSWVYDHYIKSKTFLAAFEATDVYGSYINLYPPSSLGRAHAGLKYQMTHLDLKLAYTGLFGKKFQENSVSFSFNFKF